MARYKASQVGGLAKKIRNKADKIDLVTSNSLNKTATYAKDLSAAEIRRNVNLSEGYLRGKIRTVKRASPSDLVAVIRSSTRATLLTRYPYRVTSTGVDVSINKSGGFVTINSAFVVKSLKNSGAKGIAVRNQIAAQIFEQNLARSRKVTSAMRAKVVKLKIRAKENPKGIYVLNSRSINQLFTSVREDIRPRYLRFLSTQFIDRIGRI